MLSSTQLPWPLRLLIASQCFLRAPHPPLLMVLVGLSVKAPCPPSKNRTCDPNLTHQTFSWIVPGPRRWRSRLFLKLQRDCLRLPATGVRSWGSAPRSFPGPGWSPSHPLCEPPAPHQCPSVKSLQWTEYLCLSRIHMLKP